MDCGTHHAGAEPHKLTYPGNAGSDADQQSLCFSALGSIPVRLRSGPSPAPRFDKRNPFEEQGQPLFVQDAVCVRTRTAHLTVHSPRPAVRGRQRMPPFRHRPSLKF
jgi:hypothetical protein